MPSNFDVAITRSVPLIQDFDDFDAALSPMKTSGRRSEIRMRFNLDAHELIYGFNDRSKDRMVSNRRRALLRQTSSGGGGRLHNYKVLNLPRLRAREPSGTAKVVSSDRGSGPIPGVSHAALEATFQNKKSADSSYRLGSRWGVVIGGRRIRFGCPDAEHRADNPR
jgi:hypothetical protein